MTLVYFGTADFAVPALRAVAGSVALVVTQPDRPSGRGLSLRPSPVKLAALELGLPVESPEKCRAPEFVERVRSLNAEALLVAAYGQILPQSLLDSAAHGAINLHGSVLPKYRGAAPIQRCLLEGDTETGVSLMQMDKGMDTGGVIAIETVRIGPDETAGELTVRLADLAADMARVWMPRVCTGDAVAVAQDETKATYAPKVTKAEAELSLGRPACQEYDRFRAFTPAPGAFLRTRLGQLRVWQARLRPKSGENAGSVSSVKGELCVAFDDGDLALLEVQPEGKKRVSGTDFANGARIVVGDRLIEGS